MYIIYIYFKPYKISFLVYVQFWEIGGTDADDYYI